MLNPIDDVRIRNMRPLIPPAILFEEIPTSKEQVEQIASYRNSISDVISGKDDRLLVVVGPCSIHDTKAAVEYAEKLKPVAERYEKELLTIMRVYFEKPRTVVGWKGLINDPYLDESFQINQGLRIARKLLLDVAEVGLPSGTEFLDTISPQFIADLVSWGAIGARTTESQVHRELASGLSMPIGFKNGTGGDVQLAVDAIGAAKEPHWFTSVTKQGVAAIFQTCGNESCHVILRGGGKSGPNYHRENVEDLEARLEKAGHHKTVMIDCSHGNSKKDHTRQPLVADEIATQISGGSATITGVMLESHLKEGKQSYVPSESTYGQSITDACISFEQTEPIMEAFAKAIQARRQKQAS